MNYRELYFKYNKDFNGKYQCVRCKQWFTKDQITIDHIIPQSKLMYLPIKDVLINLQSMCRHCNSSKGNRTNDTLKDLAGNIIKNAINGNIHR
jgi:5-methylcytosine-specific restriction endonuclease McrA